jgi:hypothetical protein
MRSIQIIALLALTLPTVFTVALLAPARAQTPVRGVPDKSCEGVPKYTTQELDLLNDTLTQKDLAVLVELDRQVSVCLSNMLKFHTGNIEDLAVYNRYRLTVESAIGDRVIHLMLQDEKLIVQAGVG